MKTRMLFSILALVTLVVVGSCTTAKKVSKEDYRFFSGTWINEEYNTHPFKAKIVMHPDGTFEMAGDVIPTTGIARVEGEFASATNRGHGSTLP